MVSICIYIYEFRHIVESIHYRYTPDAMTDLCVHICPLAPTQSVEAAELAQNSQVTSGHVRFLIRNHEDMVEKCNIILSSDNDLSEEKRSRKGR